MTYTIKAHPTTYRGIVFRSRLEATWAAFFDKLGWNWDYEPADLDGWVPGFIIRGAYREILVEVKPTFEMAVAAFPKALRAAPDACVAVVADGLMDRHDGPQWLRDRMTHQLGLISTPYNRDQLQTGYWLVSHNTARNLYDGHVDGDRFVGFHYGLDTKHHAPLSGDENDPTNADQFTPFVNLSALWAEAANLTRWKPQ